MGSGRTSASRLRPHDHEWEIVEIELVADPDRLTSASSTSWSSTTDGLGLVGGPEFTFDEAISLLINCADQDEVDYYWTKLTEGGEESQCGWLKDRYGLSWQVVPTGMEELLNDPDKGRAQRAMKAMLGMKKLDVAALYAAADKA